jgi:hypothetical protein
VRGTHNGTSRLWPGAWGIRAGTIRPAGETKNGPDGLRHAAPRPSLAAQDQPCAVIGCDAQVDAEGVPGGVSPELPVSETSCLPGCRGVTGAGEQDHCRGRDYDQDMVGHPHGTRGAVGEPAGKAVDSFSGGGAHASQSGSAGGQRHETAKNFRVRHGEQAHRPDRRAQGLLHLSLRTPDPHSSMIGDAATSLHSADGQRVRARRRQARRHRRSVNSVAGICDKVPSDVVGTSCYDRRRATRGSPTIGPFGIWGEIG